MTRIIVIYGNLTHYCVLAIISYEHEAPGRRVGLQNGRVIKSFRNVGWNNQWKKLPVFGGLAVICLEYDEMHMVGKAV